MQPPVSDVDPQGEPRPRAPGRSGRSRRLFRLLILPAALALLAGVVLGIRPALKVIRHWQAGNVLSQAEELARQQMFREAIERLDVALKLDPSSAEALRRLAEIYTRLELPYALPAWRALLNLPDHTEDDVHAYIDLALNLQRFDLAEARLADLLAQPRISTRTRNQAAEFFFRQGDFPRALQFAEELRRGDPTNQIHQLRSARILLNLPQPAKQLEGVELLLGIRDPNPRERLNIVHILAEAAANDSIPPATRERLSQVPLPDNASVSERLLWAEAQIRLNPAERDAILQDSVARLRDGRPEEKTELAQWLSRLGAHEKLAETFPIEAAAEYAPLLAICLENLALARRWEDLQSAATPDRPLDRWRLNCLRAVAADRLGQSALAKEQWRRAFEDAGESPAKVRALGDLAFRLGAVNEAITAFDKLTQDRLNRVAGYRRLAAVFERTGQTERLRGIMREWSAHVPDDPTPENAFCYLSGLVRRDIDLAAERAHKLLERLPRRLAYRATAALLELRRDRPDVALQLFQRAPMDTGPLPPQVRLVYATVLRAHGDTEAARDMVKGLDPEKLLPQERSLLAQVVEGS
jgi:tetratricopeptide (TPR) repeat protein